MRTPFTTRRVSFVVVLAALAAFAWDRAAATEPIPVGEHVYTYVIATTNHADPDAGTSHDIHFHGDVGMAEMVGSFQVSSAPRGLDEEVVGPFDKPLSSLYLTLNGSAFDAPDDWRPARIRVVELVNGVETRVVVDHNPWTVVFDNANRSHQIFAAY